MSLKRKYSREPDDGAKEEVGSQRGSDAVSKSLPPNFFLFRNIRHALISHSPPINPSPRHAPEIPVPFRV